MRIGSWFDPRGRLSRRDYVRFVLRLAAAQAAILCLAIALAGMGLRMLALSVAAGIAPILLAGLAQTIRRLHDRGRSGWWLAPVGLLTGPSFLPIETLADAYPVPVVIYALANLAASLWLLVETLGRAGTPDANRFGAVPPGETRSVHPFIDLN